MGQVNGINKDVNGINKDVNGARLLPTTVLTYPVVFLALTEDTALLSVS